MDIIELYVQIDCLLLYPSFWPAVILEIIDHICVHEHTGMHMRSSVGNVQMNMYKHHFSV